MNGLTTIAGLPTAGGCKAALALEAGQQNASVAAPSVGVDMAGGPDSCVMAIANGWPPLVISNSFTVGEVASIQQVRDSMVASIARHARHGSGAG